MITALYPLPVETLLAVSRALVIPAERFMSLRSGLYVELQRELPDKFALFDAHRLELDSLPLRILNRDVVGSFIEQGPEALARLTYLLEAMGVAQERIRRLEPRQYASQAMFATDGLGDHLESLAIDLSTVSQVHRRVQLHLTAATAEYVFGSPALMLKHRRELDAFYEPLAEARDRFFETPTGAALELYIEVAGKLAERPHPMADYDDLDAPPARRYEKSVERADGLLTELVSDELSLRLLEV